MAKIQKQSDHFLFLLNQVELSVNKKEDQEMKDVLRGLENERIAMLLECRNDVDFITKLRGKATEKEFIAMKTFLEKTKRIEEVRGKVSGVVTNELGVAKNKPMNNMAMAA